MDLSGKIIWAKHNEIQTANLNTSDIASLVDAQNIVLSVKDLGQCEIYPQILKHSPNGRFVVVCGDGEFIIYTALAWRNKSFGQALDFVWAQDSNEYAIRESSSSVRVFKSFKEKNVNIRFGYAAEGIYGGSLLAIKAASFLIFYDWETGAVVRRVDVVAKNVFWSDSDLVCIVGEDSFFVLRFKRQIYQAAVELNDSGPSKDEGFDEAFEFIAEISEPVSTGVWVGDCFLYTTSNNRLNYLVGTLSSTVSHFDQPVYLLGYMPNNNRIFICDKQMKVSSYSLPISIIEYQTSILRGDLENAARILSSVPADHYNRIAKFLQSQNLLELALQISTDNELKFELALKLGKTEKCYNIALEMDHEDKWKIIGDGALASWNFGLALDAWKRANDYESLFLLYQTSGNAKGLADLATITLEKGHSNIAFSCYLLLGKLYDCLNLLIDTNRLEEAALFARSYLPSEIERVVILWKSSLFKSGNDRIANSLLTPSLDPNAFPDHLYGIASQYYREETAKSGILPASAYKSVVNDDLVDELRGRFKPEQAMGAVKALLESAKNTSVNSSVNEEKNAKIHDKQVHYEVSANSLPGRSSSPVKTSFKEEAVSTIPLQHAKVSSMPIAITNKSPTIEAQLASALAPLAAGLKVSYVLIIEPRKGLIRCRIR